MHSDMSKKTKDEVLRRLRWRYATAGKEHKVKLLNQAVELLGYHRKAAIRALHQPQSKKAVSLSPGVTVGVECYAFNLQLLAALFEFCGAVAGADS